MRQSLTSHALFISIAFALTACGGGGSGSGGSANISTGTGSGSGSEDDFENLGDVFDCDENAAKAKQMLDEINALRKTKRDCGTAEKPATFEVTWNTKLCEAAVAHAKDMAEHKFVDNVGSNGQSFGERLDSVGYTYQHAGENVHKTDSSSIANLHDYWLTVPISCDNIMSNQMREMAFAYAENKDTGEYYWVEIVGSTVP